MKIFLHELQAYERGLFFWCLSMFFLVSSGMAKFAAYSTGGQSISDLMDKLPQSVQIIFGVSGFDLSTAIGYYGVLFIYIAIAACTHAVLVGSDIIGKEERDKTSEFLFVKPISRVGVLSAKLPAGLVNILILNLVVLASSLYFVKFFGKTGAYSGQILLLTEAVLFLQLIFFFLGAAIAAASKKPRSSASIGTSILLSTFILSFIVNINAKLDWLKYLTPFKYFDARALFAAGTFDPFYVWISVILILSMTISMYLSFNKRDLSI